MREGKGYLILPVLALVVATFLYLFFIPSINFGPEGIRYTNIIDFYSEIPPESVLFVGESQIRENVDCNILEEGHTDRCFNLGVNGLMPMQLALQKDLIISAKPKVVALAVTPSSFDETTNQNEDYFILLSDRNILIDDFMEKRLSDREKELLSSNFFERALYKRKFIVPFYLTVFKQLVNPVDKPAPPLDNFKDPHFFSRNQGFEELSKKLNDPELASIFEIEKSVKRQREALNYLINKLTSENIEVVLIQMPLNPLARQTIPENSIETFNDYVQKLAATYHLNLINMQDDFSPEEFTDLTHLNRQGSIRFSKIIAEGDYNIIQ